jgi:uncharacterized protein
MDTLFVVPVAHLRRAPGTRLSVSCRAPIPDLVCAGSTVPPDEEVALEAVLESVQGDGAVVVAVTGLVTASWEGECRRCLEPATGVIRVPVRELFSPVGDSEEVYPLVDELLDLEALARDAVLLELPLAPLCRGDCQGLCPTCGANRNTELCACTAPTDARWAALDILRNPADQGAEAEER